MRKIFDKITTFVSKYNLHITWILLSGLIATLYNEIQNTTGRDERFSIACWFSIAIIWIGMLILEVHNDK